MPAFEEVSDTPTPAFAVAAKPTENGAWALIGGIFATEAEATLFAQAKVGSPDNYFAARVLTPTGSLFQDAA